MTKEKILGFIFVLINAFFFSVEAMGQNNDSIIQPRVRGIQFTAPTKYDKKLNEPLFAGASISADIAGLTMALFSPWGQIEATARMNLKNKYFPIAEIGLGLSNHTDDQTSQHYKTKAPYYRIGTDFNFIKNKKSGNRILAGIRYGFTTFSYDLNGPNIIDPIWGTQTPYNFKNINSNAHWIELSAGLEAKIVKFFHIGWNVKYKHLICQKKTSLGEAWYIPGFGPNNQNCWGGSFNLIFDIN